MFKKEKRVISRLEVEGGPGDINLFSTTQESEVRRQEPD
jgi:hypothetical protein